jgi:hypothetical protein
MAKSKATVGVIILAVFLAIGAAVKYKNYQAESAAKIEELVKNCDHDREELANLYQKRIQFLLDWEKLVQLNLHSLPKELVVSPQIASAKEFTPKTEADFNQMDNIQNELGEEITHYLQSKVALKLRPPGLEKLEEAINRKRHDYHVNAFAANALIKKSGVNHELVPVFGAERLLEAQNMWK